MHSSNLVDILIKPVQSRLGLEPDGDDGILTWRAIYRQIFGVGAEPASPAPTEPVPAPPGTASRFDKILDLNHANGLDLGALLPWGLGAVIHKATEGMEFVDSKYAARKSAAMSAGILWGAYHFASGGDGIEQARHFLSVEPGTDPRVLLCLDFEPSSRKGDSNMTVHDCRAFVQYVHTATGRWPMIYGGGGLLRDELEGKMDSVLANCPLWLCDFERHPHAILPTWPKWTLLQFTDGKDGQEPKDTPGSDGADRNSFAGNIEELRAAWPFA